jgi:hypothetical protein
MTIKETLAQLKELAETPHATTEEFYDDIAAAAMLCEACTPALAPAAIQHLMQQFARRRAAVSPLPTDVPDPIRRLYS